MLFLEGRTPSETEGNRQQKHEDGGVLPSLKGSKFNPVIDYYKDMYVKAHYPVLLWP